MPDFTLSPRDLATLAQVNEARRAAPLTAEERFDEASFHASNLFGGLPIEERPAPMVRASRVWGGGPELVGPEWIYPGTPSRAGDWLRRSVANPQDAVTRYESLLTELAPFVEEARRNERALEAIPFVSAR
jgi:hypothetical protein